jgi:hypothetical protein
MAYVHDYTFNNMSRIGNDEGSQYQGNIQNTKHNNYLLTNHFSNDCMMRDPMNLALSQPSMNYKGGSHVGAEGCNIDTSSELLLGSMLTHPKCKLSLYKRPFATVPYLGRGAANPDMESQLQQGDLNINRKSVNPLMEQSYAPVSQTPLIPSVAATISNPANLVEGVAADGWIRGGLPSRELTKDNEYFKKNM